MADAKISALNAKTTIHDTDLFPMVDIEAETDETKKITWANIHQYLIRQGLLTTRGDIIYRGTSVAERLAKGTEGQFLKQGANDPTWAWALAAPTGTAEWENRTYEGWEALPAGTYTIGSGQDFETLAAAAAALQKIIMAGKITVQLQEDIELTSQVLFTNLLGFGGGYLNLDLNGHTITINMAGQAIVFRGNYEVWVEDSTEAVPSIIAKTGGDCNGTTYFVRFWGATGTIMYVDFDANSETLEDMVLVTNFGKVYFHAGVTFSDTGEGGNYDKCVNAQMAGFVASMVTMGLVANELDISKGAMVIDSEGHIHTAAGEFTP